MSVLPGGTVTFLFTDIEGSISLWERNPRVMKKALERHHAILHSAIRQHGGQVFQIVGDAFCAAFADPSKCVEAALSAQLALNTEPWEETGPLRVRMGIHTGPAEARGNDYISNHTLNRIQRIMSAGHGGQILLSLAVAELVRGHLPENIHLKDLGEHSMKGLSVPEHLFQLVAPDLPSDFPPLKTERTSLHDNLDLPDHVERQGDLSSVLPQNEMKDVFEILSTKLAPPRLRSPLVPRDQLLARLDEGLEHKLTLVSAPAGFGKTTLVAEWIERAHEPQKNLERSNLELSNSVAWVSLDSNDNDPVRFWRYFLTACNAFHPEISNTALKLLSGSQQPPFEAVLTAFINELARLSGKRVIVLEDYHVIDSRQINDMLAFLLDYLPDTLHIIMLTRSDPPLPLARLRAQNELNELRAADLRFSLPEVQAFLQQTVSLPISPDVSMHLAERTEGWAAGLRLVALALQRFRGQPDLQSYIATFTGSHRPILEYLIADVFNAQPEPVQEFLLQTSVLSRLTGSLCDAVTGRSDSAALLEQLERANLFIEPLDASRQWYRYHDLFAEAMRHYALQRLGEPHLHEVAHQASLWYERQAMLAEAVEASLSAQDFPRAAGLIERLLAPRLVQNEYHTLRRWMEQIPEEVLRAHPELCLAYAMAIVFTSDRYAPAQKEQIEMPLQIAEQHWQAEENERKLGEVLAFRAIAEWRQGEFVRSFTTARQALELLPEDEMQWRGISLIFVAAEELYAGKLNAARQTLARAHTLNEDAGNIYGILDTLLLFGEACTRQGELHQAAQFYRQVLTILERTPMDRGDKLLRRGRALNGLAALALEWNNLEEAEQAASQAREIGQELLEEDLSLRATLVLASVQKARGETDQAQQLLHALVAQVKDPMLLREAHACRSRHALLGGDVVTAQRWSVYAEQQDLEISILQKEQEALVLARLQIARGDAGEALRLLASWQAEAQAQGRVRSELEARILMALAYAALKDIPRARQTLIQALRQAQPAGYQRLFLDEGQPLLLLLQDVLVENKDEPLANYVRTLLYAQARSRTGQETAPAPGAAALIEPLSEQEQRVLRLLAAGLSNPEIAQELVVSVNTVKTHIKNIYRKLNVSSRSEARQAARHLKLI